MRVVKVKSRVVVVKTKSRVAKEVKEFKDGEGEMEGGEGI